MKKEVFDFYDRTSLKSYNLDKTMQDQLKALGQLDVFTRKHCENVAAITCRICEYLHCKKSFTEYCTICAYMHDIGKIFIPSSILQKPGKLTEEEYETMKTHTEIGYKMCIRDLKLRPYAAGPLYHHEALDGSGYPQGLTKKDIPYEGQIIRVADEYDAISSKRQYKTHIGISDTLKIIIENSKPREIKPSDTLKVMVENTKPQTTNGKKSKYGRDNPLIVKALIKVVLDDIYYEISCAQDYIEYLKENIKRFKTIDKYYQKMLKAKTQKSKEYYTEYMKLYFEKGETLGNFQNVGDDFRNALKLKQAKLDELYKEISIIKKLKV